MLIRPLHLNNLLGLYLIYLITCNSIIQYLILKSFLMHLLLSRSNTQRILNNLIVHNVILFLRMFFGNEKWSGLIIQFQEFILLLSTSTDPLLKLISLFTICFWEWFLEYIIFSKLLLDSLTKEFLRIVIIRYFISRILLLRMILRFNCKIIDLIKVVLRRRIRLLLSPSFVK